VPGARIWWEMHYHAVGEEISNNVELAVYLYPKGEEPKYRTFLTGVSRDAWERGDGHVGYPSELGRGDGGFSSAACAGTAREFSAAYALARQSHAAGSDPAGRIETNAQLRGSLQLQLDDQLHLRRRCGARAAQGTIIHVVAWHDNTINNPNNPDPEQWVGWGDRTVDEMAHAWVNVTYISDEDYQRGWQSTAAGAASARNLQ